MERGRRKPGLNELQLIVGQKLRDEQTARQKTFEENEEKFKLAGYSWHRWSTHGSPKIYGSRNHHPCGLVISDPAVHDPLCPANDKGRTEPLLSEL